MNILALDTETPRFDKKELWRGNVYGDNRPIVCWSAAYNNKSEAFMWHNDSTHSVQKYINSADLVVGFNFKHDLGYFRKHGIDFSKTRIWDVQLAEFVIGRQLNKFPSLDDTCHRYGLPAKLDVVKTEFWDKGLDTCDVPEQLLCDYAAMDAELTLKCYHAQLSHLTPAQRTLVSLMSQDLLVLQEMEQNGLIFDEKICAARSKELDNEISTLTKAIVAGCAAPINLGSNDDLSAFLYGGTIKEDAKEFIGYYKTGIKAGQPKYKNVTKEHVLPRLFEPLKGSELMKEGFYETNEGTLKKLKAGKNKQLLDNILQLSKLEKLNGTYYRGLPKLREAMHWPMGKLHGQFNQTLAGTGRLSSSKPNQQNFASEIQDIFVSQYE